MIFTTALPPINVAWTCFIFEQLVDFDALRQNLHHISKVFAESLNSESTTHIIPYILGENDNAVQCSQYMQDKGFYVLPIRHPTVPVGTARLRFSLTADIEISQISQITETLKSFVPKYESNYNK